MSRRAKDLANLTFQRKWLTLRWKSCKCWIPIPSQNLCHHLHQWPPTYLQRQHTQKRPWGQTSAETADASASSAEPKRHESLSDRSRGRNLVSKAVEAEKSQSQDSNELQVLNSSCTSDGLDIYGGLVLRFTTYLVSGFGRHTTTTEGPGIWYGRLSIRHVRSRQRTRPSAVVDETAGMVDTPPLQTQQQEAALQKVLAGWGPFSCQKPGKGCCKDWFHMISYDCMISMTFHLCKDV